MNKLIFTPQMFHGRQINEVWLSNIEAMFSSQRAQEIFDTWLEEQPIVYGDSNLINGGCSRTFGLQREKDDIHKARLVYIENIEKPCEHEPTSNSHKIMYGESIPIFMSEAHCKKCGVNLKAKWEEV